MNSSQTNDQQCGNTCASACASTTPSLLSSNDINKSLADLVLREHQSIDKLSASVESMLTFDHTNYVKSALLTIRDNLRTVNDTLQAEYDRLTDSCK